MPTAASTRKRVVGALREQADGYGHGEERPLRGYATTMAVYGGLVGAITAGVRLTGRDLPDGLSLPDVGLCAAATFKLSRLLAKDPVTSPLRAPFASYQGQAGPAELKEDVRSDGEPEREVIGELVTCPFCTSVWVATGMAAGLIFFPRATRTAMSTLAALAGADLLQYTHAWLNKATS